MSLLKRIEDKGAVLEWSPLSTRPDLVALGTKDSSGIGFDDYGGELEIHSLNISDSTNPSTKLLGNARANSRFSSLAWSQMATNQSQYPYGLIAGGMMDGVINVWNPAKILESDAQSLIASVEQHQGAIGGLQFNPHKESSHLLASGGNDSEVFVMSLERPDAPNVFIPAPPPNNAKHTADITKVCWNSQVAHILGTASQNGVCFIWDLRQKKAWCELRDPTGGSIADIAWNPEQGLHIVTASGEDRNPVIKLWDLRSSTSVPLATLQGHTEGILSVSWCPHDPTLLVSCGKDNRTIVWDLFSLQPAYELPTKGYSAGLGMSKADQSDISQSLSPAKPDTTSSIFGGMANTVGQRRHNIQWSPHMKSVISASSFDRKVQFFSLSGTTLKTKRAPKWLKRSAGVAFGFGGKLCYFDNAIAASTDATKSVSPVHIIQTVEDSSLISSCDTFQKYISDQNLNSYKSYCEVKSESQNISKRDKEVWELMNVICFDKNARQGLLSYLGFKPDDIAKTVENYVQSKNPLASVTSSVGNLNLSPPPTTTPPVTTPSVGAAFALADPTLSAESVFGSSEPLSPSTQAYLEATEGDSSPVATPASFHKVVKTDVIKSSPLLSTITESHVEVSTPTPVVSAPLTVDEIAAEKLIREAIIVGNFKAAVECCLETGQLAEALILAQCGEQDLWVKTQEAFFEKQKSRHAFISILHAIIKSDLLNYVLKSDLLKWKETLAILSTYGKSDEFPAMCEKLGFRLESEVGDYESATLCYMCAVNITRTVSFWTDELKASRDSKGKINTNSLQNYIEKVVVFTQANPGSSQPADSIPYFIEYANLLASQGRFDTALSYLKSGNQVESALVDRLYHASGTVKVAGSKAPVFPFEKVTVNVVTSSSGAVSATTAPATTKPSVATSSVAATPTVAATRATPAATTTAAVKGGAAAQVLAPGWAATVDPNTGRTYYYNASTGQSQWDAPLAASTPAPVAATPVQTQSQFQPQSQAPHQAVQSQQPVQRHASTAVHPSQAALQQQSVRQQQQPAPTFTPITQQPVSYPAQSQAPYQQQQPHPSQYAAPVSAMPASVTPKAAPIPEPVKPKELLPDSEAILLLEQVIVAVTAAAGPAEKRQMTMVNDAFACLRKKASEGDVAPEIQQKVLQLAGDILQRNFISASAIQADLANTAWNQHKDWIKGLKVFIQIASKK